jgi:hypothetical protein
MASWKWAVDGIEDAHGTLQRPFNDSGVVEAEQAGEALDWLVNHGPMWDCLDTDHVFTITISPA